MPIPGATIAWALAKYHLKGTTEKKFRRCFELRPAADYNGTGFFLATAAATAGKIQASRCNWDSQGEAYWISANTSYGSDRGQHAYGVGHGIFATSISLATVIILPYPAWACDSSNPYCLKLGRRIGSFVFHRRIWYYGTIPKSRMTTISGSQPTGWVAVPSMLISDILTAISSPTTATPFAPSEWFYPVMKKGTRQMIPSSI